MRIKRADADIAVVPTLGAPSAIESARDAAQVAPLVLERIKQASKESYDAIIIACFSDPGLQAAREISDVLVLGIAETSLHIAAMLGHRFTVLTPLEKRIPSKEREVRYYGLGTALASVRALGLTVQETDINSERTKERILAVAQQAIIEDGAEVIVLGCAGMAGYAEDIEKELNIVVIDPMTLTFKICEALVDLRVHHSKKRLYML